MDKKLRKLIEEIKELPVCSYNDLRNIWNESIFHYWFQLDIACFDEYVRLAYGGHHNKWKEGITFGDVVEDFNDYIEGEDWEESTVVPFEVFAVCLNPSSCGWTDHGEELPDYMNSENPRFDEWAESVRKFCTEWHQEKHGGGSESQDEMICYLYAVDWLSVDFGKMDESQLRAVFDAMKSILE